MSMPASIKYLHAMVENNFFEMPTVTWSITEFFPIFLAVERKFLGLEA